MINQKQFLCLITILSLSSCGAKDGSSSEDSVNQSSTTERYQYSFTLNECGTGEHSFSSKNELCDGLKNDSLNNGCAEGMRLEKFQTTGCSGDFLAAEIPSS